MQVTAKIFSCALLPIILASLVAVTFSNDEITDEHLIQFMSSFTHKKHIVSDIEVNENYSAYQIYNHLNHTNYHKWTQYYYEYDKFFDIGDNKGPIILVIVGASELTELDKRHPIWIELAQRTNGLLFFLEHRYYGRSLPTPSTSEEFKQYFNNDEALYDISYFIDYYRSYDFETNKWIIVGEGRGGILAAWTRMKFPHLVDSAVVVNAPLVAKWEDNEYFNLVSATLSSYQNVLETMTDAYHFVAHEIKDKRFDNLIDNLKLCTNLGVGNELKNIQYMYWSVTWNLGLITKIEDTENAKYKTTILEAFADPLLLPIQRLKKALEIILVQNQLTCIHVDYDEAVNLLKIEDYDAQERLPKTLRTGLGNRQFLWQSCIDFGYMKTSTKENMFGDVPLTFFFELCKDVFGDWYEESILVESIRTTKMLYNEADINVTKTLFINYDNQYEKLFTVHEDKNRRDIKIVNVPDVPDKSLTQNEREDLLKKYNEIFEYIKDQACLERLEPPNVQARRVSDFDEGADKRLIQFMSSFMDVKQIVPQIIFKNFALKQKYNHLNRVETKRWNQPGYYYNNYVASDLHPIILVIGTLSGITEQFYQNPVWLEIAQRSEALLFVFEQRYYGLSSPTGHSVDSYRTFLSTEQALYDIAEFIRFFKLTFPVNKWIIVGEGHGGKLAAWFRLKFPNLVDGALAINAPLIPKLEFKEYFDIVHEQLSKLTGVMETIKGAYAIIAEDIKHSRFGALQDKLKLCSAPGVNDKKENVKNEKNLQYMLWSISWFLGLIPKLYDMEGASYKTSVLNVFKDPTKTNPIHKLKKVLEIIISRYQSSCIHVDYEEAILLLKNENRNAEGYLHQPLFSGLGNRESLWLSCTDFGYMKTSTEQNMFGNVPLDFFTGLCKEVFGEWYDKTILEKSLQTTKMFYNGKDMEASNILFINHDNDTSKVVTIYEKTDNQDFTIVNVPDVPDTPEKLTIDMRIDLVKKYNDIFEFIQNKTGVTHLKERNIDARRVSFGDEKADKQIIVFMASFTNIKTILSTNGVINVKRSHFVQEYNYLNRNHLEIHWNQNCYVNNTYYKEGGPIILVVEALSALTTEDSNHTIWTEFIQRSRGILYLLDHRYYGFSQPTDHTTENYAKYLNSEQALYDTAKLSEALRETYPKSKIIAVGESYGGNLAAWVKYKFPDKIDGAVVLNAPLIPKVEFKEYFDLVNKHLSQYQNVMETIREAYEAISEDIDNLTYANLQNKFNLCSDLSIGDGKKNIEYMLWSITWNLGTIMELNDTDRYKIEILTAFADTSQSDPVVRLKEVLEVLLRRSGLKCIHVKYAEAVEWLKNPDLKTEHEMDKTLRLGIGKRPKFWEICMEFGHLKTSTKDNMFGDVKLEFFIGLCKDVFGDWYNAAILENSVKTTKMFYAGNNMDTNNILFINYENMYEKTLAISHENEVNQNFKIISIPKFPTTAEEFTIDMRVNFIETYHEIYRFIKEISGLRFLAKSDINVALQADVAYVEKKKDEAETSAGSTAAQDKGN